MELTIASGRPPQLPKQNAKTTNAHAQKGMSFWQPI